MYSLPFSVISMSSNASIDYAKGKSQNNLIQPLLTDMYEITMAYVYWKNGKLNENATFDLFFRKNPFHGEFTIFAGLEECIRFIKHFRYSDSDISYLKSILPPTTEPEFFEYLSKITMDEVTVYALDEGTVVFPKLPMMRIEGPLILAQLVETTILTLVNYASLLATNAARYRLVAGENVRLIEFGLRRAQGPDGGLSSSKYAFIGGFDCTSNLLAGKMYNIPVGGTHAHSYITSFIGRIINAFTELKNSKSNNSFPDTNDLSIVTLPHKVTNESINFLELATTWRRRFAGLFQSVDQSNDGEFAAFVSYAISFPNLFVALVDTYDMRKSGLINFCAVAMALFELKYKPIGIRIDSGDLAYLSRFAYDYFAKIAEKCNIPEFKDLVIMVSNDINEETIMSLNDQGHKITSFGIGTHLVTCQKQPALGCVYKMVEINGHARMKISQDFEKMTLPGRKEIYRLYGAKGDALIDIMQTTDEPEPQVGEKVLCRHPFDRSKRSYVIPQKVDKLLQLYWKDGKVVKSVPDLDKIKEHVQESLRTLRQDVKRYLNPTPYKIAVSEHLYNVVQDQWLENAPIGELV